MSLIPVESTAPVSELPGLLRRWITIQEEVATLNTELRQRKTQSKALKDVILRIMDSNKVVQLNVTKGTVVHKTREVSESLSNGYLLKHCSEFFGGDMAKAESLVNYLDEHRGTTVRHDLRFQIPKATGSGSGSGSGSSSSSSDKLTHS
jgi:hypothetical protein